MADEKISLLAPRGPLNGNEVFPIVQNGGNRKMLLSDVLSLSGVQSVNGEVGAVVLDADDVGAVPVGGNISVLINDVGYLVGFANQTQAETAASTILNNRDNANSFTARSFRWAFDVVWTYIKTQIQTFAAQITFTLPPKFSSTTANHYLKADGNKDLTSVASVPYNDVSKAIVSQSISGSVTIDLSQGNIFVLTLTGNVTSFNYSNATIGKDYYIRIIKTADNTFTFASNRYNFPNGSAPQTTNPIANGYMSSTDYLTFLCVESVNRIDVVATQNMRPN